MKKIIFAFSLVSMFAVVACKKDNSAPVSSALTASKTDNIKISEPVVFTYGQAVDSSAITWSANPASQAKITVKANQASVLFSAKGSYTVTALYHGSMYSKTVNVIDSIYTSSPGSTSNIAIANTDVIKVSVTKVDSANQTFLAFSAKTTSTYPCPQELVYVSTVGTGTFMMNFSGITTTANCTSANVPATTLHTDLMLPQTQTTLSINVNGNTYTGSVTKSGSTFTISWPNTTAAVITPTNF